MCSFNLLQILLFGVMLLTTEAQVQQPYHPTEQILLNCGEQNNSTSNNELDWIGHANSKYCLSDPQTSSLSSISVPLPPPESGDQLPYLNARISYSNFTYTFPVVPGQKFIRLHFYPATYLGLDKSESFFTVIANNFTLLSNFSAYLTASAVKSKTDVFFKEFIVPVFDHQDNLNITFIPSPSSYAFINGIEIISMPTNLYTTETDKTLINYGSQFPIYNTTALETLYRISVGGREIASIEDTGMLRRWDQDANYLHVDKHFPVDVDQRGIVNAWYNLKINYTADMPAYIAPAEVYQARRSMGQDPNKNLKYNLTWIFPNIDPEFDYLLRLHFCEVYQKITAIQVVEFTIFINNMVAEPLANVLAWAGGDYNVPVKREYVVRVPNVAGQKKQGDMLLQLHPNSGRDIAYADATLNAIEIFKLSSISGNLAGLNPELKLDIPPGPEQTSPVKETKKPHMAAIIGAVLGSVFTLALILFACFLYQRKRKQAKLLGPFSFTSKSSSTGAALLPTDICKRFSIIEIREAARNFDDENFIGVGGFGNVYKGYMNNGTRVVAIKRLGQSSAQGTEEFHTEIKMLSSLRHVNLVSLIGYCDDQGEMILVYEYMERGTLRDHLYNKGNPPLSWKQRLEICIGIAKGLQYLHSGVKSTIIHRDVKSSNILLDENWRAKVSDFGLSKIGPTSISQTHVSTMVKGSFGYLDPEYFRRQRLTEKSDIYSFGVILLEVLCARPAVNCSLPEEQMSLAEWARHCYQQGTIDQIIDPHLNGDIKKDCMDKFVEIAYSCTRSKGTERPVMGDIIWSLEFCLQLQERSVNHGTDNIPSTLQEKEICSDNSDEPPSLSFSGLLFHSSTRIDTQSESFNIEVAANNFKDRPKLPSSSSEAFPGGPSSLAVIRKTNSRSCSY